MPLTKKDIVKKALPLFLEYGYEAISMNQLLKYLGMSKGGYYHHLNNKEELAIMVAESLYANQFDIIMDICRGVDTLRDKINRIRDIVKEYLSVLDEIQLMNSYIFMFQMNRKSSVINDRIKGNYSGLYNAAIHMIKQAADSEEIRSSVDVESQALIFIALIEGMLIISGAMLRELNGHIGSTFDSFYNGLKGDKR